MNNRTDDILLRSFGILEANLMPNSLLVVFGAIGILFGSTSIFLMSVGKEMRSRYYSNCLYISAANVCCCTTLFCVGLKRVIVYSLSIGEVSNVRRCALDVGAVIYFSDVCLTQNFCLAFDRLISLSFPFFYKETYERIGQLVNIFFCAFMLMSTILISVYGLNEESEVPVCTKNFVYNEWTQNLEEDLLIGIASFSVATNIVVALLMKWKNHKAKGLETGFKRKREHRLVQLMSYVVLTDLIIWVSGDQILNRIFATFTATMAAKSYPYIPIIYCFPPVMNFIFYVSADPKFREKLQKCRSSILSKNSVNISNLNI